MISADINTRIRRLKAFQESQLWTTLDAMVCLPSDPHGISGWWDNHTTTKGTLQKFGDSGTAI